MIISHSRRLIVFSFPKTGSESLRALLAPLAEEPVLPWRQRSRLCPFYPHMPPREAAAAFRARGWDFDGYRRVTVVRNPYPRLVSLYRMICEVDGLWTLRRRLGLGVPSFGRWLAGTRPDGRGGGGRPHQRWRRFGAWSARSWIHDEDGRPLVTDVLRLEHLEAELPPVLSALDLSPPQNLPVLNAREPVAWESWYGDAERALVAARYAWDLETFYRNRAPPRRHPLAA